MKAKLQILCIFFLTVVISSCTNKRAETVVAKKTSTIEISPKKIKEEESIEGIYKTAECDISVKITKTKDGYRYFLKTNVRKLEGKATYSENESGEKYLILEGIKWDAYEGDISNEEETDSVAASNSEPLEIPIGIGANYVKDTLTIQNYGNSMNSYTKISECGLKYIQLIKR